ncbi:uncharacterized protein LOC143646854 isoform X2 [Tamandua tetradactyla]|uniref:uncharacterized protein LOC143646854 isoform X2 n=1 Tax=Tamandua tetradactyla TaxID=48850 RepID=UPI0040545121
MAAGPPPGAADAPRLPPRPAGQRRRAVAGRAAVGALRSCWSPPTWTRLGTPRKPAEEPAAGVESGLSWAPPTPIQQGPLLKRFRGARSRNRTQVSHMEGLPLHFQKGLNASELTW